MAGATQRAGGLAKGRGGAGQQERQNRLGGIGQRPNIQPQSCVHQAGGDC